MNNLKVTAMCEIISSLKPNEIEVISTAIKDRKRELLAGNTSPMKYYRILRQGPWDPKRKTGEAKYRITRNQQKIHLTKNYLEKKDPNLLDRAISLDYDKGGGFYFANEEHIYQFFNWGLWISEVKLPPDCLWEEIKEGNETTGILRASDIILFKPQRIDALFLSGYLDKMKQKGILSFDMILEIRGLFSWVIDFKSYIERYGRNFHRFSIRMRSNIKPGEQYPGYSKKDIGAIANLLNQYVKLFNVALVIQ